MTNTDATRMYHRWLEMWNGRPELAAELVAAGWPIHFQPSTGGHGPDGVREMVEMGRAPFDDITFRIEAEPIVEGNRLAARWSMLGRYRGGLPGATAAPGTEVSFGGIDIWRIEDGKIAEYWVSSDGLHLMAQLGAGQEPDDAS